MNRLPTWAWVLLILAVILLVVALVGHFSISFSTE